MARSRAVSSTMRPVSRQLQAHCAPGRLSLERYGLTDRFTARPGTPGTGHLRASVDGRSPARPNDVGTQTIPAGARRRTTAILYRPARGAGLRGSVNI